MGKEFDLHRHDEYSTFDGYGKPEELAKIAKELGYNSLCTTNHGNTNGLVQTYKACKDNGLKAILGVEGYFLPKYIPQTRGFHLILIAKNLVGYGNMNRIQYEGDMQKYYNPIWDFSILEEHSEGLICTSACVAGYLGQCIKGDSIDKAKRYLKRMQSIFGDDFYIEIQPYDVDEEKDGINLQRYINIKSIELAEELGIKCILTSDSHRGRKEDWESYLKMHEVAGHNLDHIEDTYKERYMPVPGDLKKRFYKMHKADFGEARTKKLAMQMVKNLEEIEDKCELNYLDQLEEKLPVLYDNSYKVLVEHVKQGLKDRGKYNKKYIDRAKEELDVIKFHHFEDYFLMVEDYVNWAKDHGIAVGPGRGSACNSIICYALKITEVDSIYFNLEFRRFLMKERHKMPDIDLDFETDRRGEVIEYLLNKYEGHSAQICSYGLYRVDNLINDLAKVCGLRTDKEVDASDAKINKQIKADIKKFVNSYIDEGFLDREGLKKDERYKSYNDSYDNIMMHFLALYEKVRFIGTHAAGVAITGGNILDYAAVRMDTKTGKLFTAYDLIDMEAIGVIKFDMLGLKTMSELNDCRKATGTPGFDISMIEDENVIAGFAKGDCNGVFQLDKASVQQLLLDIHTSNFNDVVAASAMNRPGPLKQKMPELYAANKEAYELGEDAGSNIRAFDEYLKETYGTIIYQEQIMRMAVDIAGMTWDEAHNITKMKIGVPKFNYYFENDYPRFEQAFVNGCKKLGVPADTAKDIFKKFYDYSFNKGHSVGYSLISVEQMYYKVYYPEVFWFAKIKYANDDSDFFKYCENAVGDGAVVFLPHVNYSRAKSSLRKIDGEFAIQQGLSSIKGVGEVAANAIVAERKANGIFTSYDNFLDRVQDKKVNKKVLGLLIESGALEFKKSTYISRVKKYNSSLYARADRKRS
jgi:DNA polymerase-3 subunit alpha|nr:MAG TPA: DNA polymerase III, alpha subunit [Caudoviricetes sp.]